MEDIKIENLSFTYPSRKAPALCGISISVNSGDFVLICGKSGCGKSTLLRKLKPSVAPYGITSGKIYYSGKVLDTLTLREETEKIGFVLQNPDNQVVCDKVWHELAFGLENLSLSNVEIRARVAETALFFGIQNWFRRNTSELSGGEKQLLNLASVMVMQPSVIILDEPTSQLDPISAHDFLETLSRINKELGITVIMSEQRLEEAFPIADKVVLLENGRVLIQGTPKEICMSLCETNCMYAALPTPVRVCNALKCGSDCPITVRDGRKWLSDMKIKDRKITDESADIKKTEVAVDLNDVWFRYEKKSNDVLRGLSLKVCKGEFYAIVGGNGVGKTTALSVISGIVAPYRGKVKLYGNKVAALPQNPQSLFSKKTVMLELEDMLSDTVNDEHRKHKLDEVIKFCELENLVESHPYDLSGGEQQRAALAKVLLCEPNILVLDEPTKGLDACFKIKLAGLVKHLTGTGKAVIAVSHDIEFCAKYSDRCAMFFDGQIVSENPPREFFSGKNFYTTAANRMSRNIIKDAVLDTDIIKAIE